MKKTLLTVTMLTVALTPLLQAQRTIRIIFGTTTGVRNDHGGNSNTNSLLSTKFGQVRDSNNNSSTGINWTRPSHFRATYNSRNQTAATQLNRLRTGSQLRGFRNRRDDTNSDIMQLYCDWSNLGTAGLWTQPGAFSVVRNSFLSSLNNRNFGGRVHIHEVGHNMNATHGQGHCYANNSRRTLMIPTTESCGAANGNYRHVFSSSTRSFQGHRTGKSNTNNRSRIRSRRNAAANQR